MVEATSAEPISVLVEGEKWSGWNSVQVVRTLDSCAGSFRLGIPLVRGRRWPILPGQAIKVLIGDDLICTGFVDRLEATLDNDGRRIEIEGRDRTADLVDCSSEAKAFEWRGLELAQIVAELVSPYGILIDVQTKRASERFELFSRTADESAWDVIERACRTKGVLAYTLENGTLALAPIASKIVTGVLTEGGNIHRASVRWDVSGRYATYEVEAAGRGGDDSWGEQVISIKGSSKDSAIDRHRLLVIRGEDHFTREDAQRMAEWEATARRARSTAIEVEVLGWRHLDRFAQQQQPWRVNQLASVILREAFGIAGDFLVSRVEMNLGESGESRTMLELVPPDAFIPQPVVAKPVGFDDFLTDDTETDTEGE